MAEIRPTVGSAISGRHILGGKLDSIPFSAYHVLIIAVLALVGFVEGYDLAITGSLLVLAKQPLHLTEADIRWIAVGPSPWRRHIERYCRNRHCQLSGFETEFGNNLVSERAG
jgi:hypothetical protein